MILRIALATAIVTLGALILQFSADVVVVVALGGFCGSVLMEALDRRRA